MLNTDDNINPLYSFYWLLGNINVSSEEHLARDLIGIALVSVPCFVFPIACLTHRLYLLVLGYHWSIVSSSNNSPFRQ